MPSVEVHRPPGSYWHPFGSDHAIHAAQRYLPLILAATAAASSRHSTDVKVLDTTALIWRTS